MPSSLKKMFHEQTAQLRSTLDALDDWYASVEAVIERLREAFLGGKIVYVAGNGGSAALALHFSDEMVGRYKADRRPYPVVALTADAAVITCIANDFGFEEIFRRQIKALGQPGDVLMAFSTSGNSANVLAACQQAASQGMTVIGFTSATGQLKNIVDIGVISPSTETARIQELDLHAIHLICHAFESA